MADEAESCPLCGAPFADPPSFAFDAGSGHIVSRGRVIRLTRMEAELFEALRESRGRPMTVDDIKELLYTLECDWPESNTEAARISKLNVKLRGSGFHISNAYGFGYVLKRAE